MKPRRIFLHPLKVDLFGDHPVADWMQRFFSRIGGDTEGSAHLNLDFVSGKLPAAKAESSFRFDGHHFRCQLETGGDTWNLLLASPRGQSCWPLTLRKPDLAWKTWLSHGASLDVLRCKEMVYQILPFVAHCRLLEMGAAIVHASCFAVGERAILLPALGGVGKSAIMTGAVLGGGARFIADDLLVIDRKGQAYFSPIPIHYYSYHLSGNAELVSRVLPRGSLQWSLAKALYPKRAVRWTSPFDVWKPTEMAERPCPLGEVFFMRRGGGELRCAPSSPEEIARVSTRIIFREIGHLPDRLAAAGVDSSGQPALPSLAEVWSQTEGVYRECFSRAERTDGMSIPSATKLPELSDFFSQTSELLPQS